MYRHTFFFLAIMLLFSASAQAQFKIGFKGGALASSFSDGGIGLSSGIPADAKYSYLSGAVVAYPVYEKGFLQAELLYSNEGIRAESSDLGVVRDHLHYLSLPILLQHEVANGLSVGAGPEISYLLAAYQRTEEFGGRPLSWYRPFEFGININAQYYLLEQLAIGLRYNIGLSDITENIEVPNFGGGTTVVDTGDLYNRSLQLSLMYWLR